MMDQFSQEEEKHYQTVLDNYELGRLIGCGCNAAVYEARLRSSNSQSNESDIEILSQHSSIDTDNEPFTEDISTHCMMDSCSTNSDILPGRLNSFYFQVLFKRFFDFSWSIQSRD